MPKINKITLNKVSAAAPVKDFVKVSGEVADKTGKKVASAIDTSCEELGFFVYKGKVYNVIFPR